MKIAYISVYRDGTGYGNAALSMMEAISKAGHDVVPIWITLNKTPFKNSEFVSKLEGGDLDNCDMVIQQCLPDMFVRISGVKNIGYFFWETDSFNSSGWKSGCELMDEIWVTTEEQALACINSGVNKSKIKIIDQPKENPKVNSSIFDLGYEVKNTYKFYTVSDYSNKKNINALIHGFLTEFSVHDNVSLIIKSYVSGKSKSESSFYIKNVISELKKQIGKREQVYPKIVLITEMLSDDDLCSLEETCDCFVSMSRGEGEGLPLCSAAMRGKPVIAPKISGIKKNFLYQDLLISSFTPKKVFGMNSDPYYNWQENWLDPSTTELCEKMRFVLENPELVRNIVQENKKFLEDNFSIDACAKKMEALI